MSNWINADRIDLEKHQSFVYRIDRLAADGVTIEKSYIGKKWLTSTKTKKLTLKEVAALPKKPGKKPTKKKVVSESDWQNYWSSSTELKADLKTLGPQRFRRTILVACATKKGSGYWECHYLFNFGVLLDPQHWYNYNIGGTMYGKDAISGEVF